MTSEIGTVLVCMSASITAVFRIKDYVHCIFCIILVVISLFLAIITNTGF